MGVGRVTAAADPWPGPAATVARPAPPSLPITADWSGGGPPTGARRGGGRAPDTVGAVNLIELQDVIERTYGDRDRHRGVAPTVAWLAEEFGELAQAVRKGTRAEIEHEFSDVLAWLATLANQVGVDLTAVVDRYRAGCPKCARIPCAC